MAKAVINLQKESGGIVKISPVDGIGVTEVTVPESGELATKDYVDINSFNPTPIIATGTATFNSTTNNINLTGIGIGVEIGDVIQISGAEDTKNNSEFTVEVITDDNNVIVNQAHANKGTSKNVANRVGGTGVTVELLSKWYNAPIGLGQGWVDVSSSRSIGTTYNNNTNRSVEILISGRHGTYQIGSIFTENNVIPGAFVEAGAGWYTILNTNISPKATYATSYFTSVFNWFERR